MLFKNKVTIGAVTLIFMESLLFYFVGRYDPEFFFVLITFLLIVVMVVFTSGTSSKSFSRGNWQGTNMKGSPIGNVMISDDMIKPENPMSIKGKVKKPIEKILLILLILNIVSCIISFYLSSN